MNTEKLLFEQTSNKPKKDHREPLNEGKKSPLRLISDKEDTQLEELSDGELIHIAEQMGMEDGIIRDGEGGLVNREEIIKEIKEVEEDARK